MKNLNPTLWRTCKMLTGKKRIQLLRQLYEHPGWNVTEYGHAVGIKRSDASQELRRIQSRGLLKSERKGIPLIYCLRADPQVSSAAPLLRAIQSTLASSSPKHDLEMCRISQGLSNKRRIAIIRALLLNPCAPSDLQMHLHLSRATISQHLQLLIHSGFAVRNHNLLHFKMPSHSLARALIRLLKQT